MSKRYHIEIRGVMTRFEPVTKSVFQGLPAAKLTYGALVELLEKHKLCIANVVFDSTRSLENMFYADYERGVYFPIYLWQSIQIFSQQLAVRSRQIIDGSDYLKNKQWRQYYLIDVPLPMTIYDFQRRVYDIEPNHVFEVWFAIHKRIDYSNGMWTQDTLQYVFGLAPELEAKPPVGEDGLVTLYRGMGTESQPANKAISWSTNPINALWFANHSYYGKEMAVAKVKPTQIIAYFPGFWQENEAILAPGKFESCNYEDMIPATLDEFLFLITPVMKNFLYLAKQSRVLKPYSNNLGDHDLCHSKRVLLLSLIFCRHSDIALSPQDRDILVYFSLLHDIGRENDHADTAHGQLSVQKIRKCNLQISGVPLSKKEQQIAELIIIYHCQDDEAGLAAINSQRGFTSKDKRRACTLYQIAKDLDALDRVRFNGLDYTLLRTAFAKKLPFIAGHLLHQDNKKFIQNL